MSDPQLKKLSDGTLVAFFTIDMKMVDEGDPSAEIVHAVKPDGESIWLVKDEEQKQ